VSHRPRVVVTRHIHDDALELLRPVAELMVWEESLPPPRDWLLERARDAVGLLPLLTERIDAALLDGCPKLRVVSTMAVGVDHIDVAACTARGIPVGHTPGVLTDATADFAFALLLAAARRVVEGDAFARSGKWRTWQHDLLLGRSLAGATLGLAGLGAIGQAVARRAQGFGMRVLGTRRQPLEVPGVTLVDKPTLLKESDFLSLHLPLTNETRHWLGAGELVRMKPSAVLINTARGGVVDQQALLAALDERIIAFAALDVTDPEPPLADDPLLRRRDVLLAPHLGSATEEARRAMATLAAENLRAVLEGQRPPHVVNPEVLPADG